jgi:FlaG/FlaF family flagellin (archaellin)
MVAITVILAAVIGTFVLGLGGNVNSAPQAQFSYSFGADYTDDSADGDTFSIVHDGGDTITASTLSIAITNPSSSDVSENDVTATSGAISTAWGTDISAGDEITLTEGTGGSGPVFDSGSTVRIIWNSPEGGSSNTISQAELPG